GWVRRRTQHGRRLRMLSAPYGWLVPYVGFEFEVRTAAGWGKYASYARAAVGGPMPEPVMPRGDGVRLRAVMPGDRLNINLARAVVEEHFEDVLDAVPN